MATSAQTLITSAIGLGYDALSDRDLKECLLVAAQAGGGGGGGGTSQVFAANYSGGQPNFTPTTSTAIAFDTNNGTEWAYYSGAWH